MSDMVLIKDFDGVWRTEDGDECDLTAFLEEAPSGSALQIVLGDESDEAEFHDSTEYRTFAGDLFEDDEDDFEFGDD